MFDRVLNPPLPLLAGLSGQELSFDLFLSTCWLWKLNKIVPFLISKFCFDVNFGNYSYSKWRKKNNKVCIQYFAPSVLTFFLSIYYSSIVLLFATTSMTKLNTYAMKKLRKWPEYLKQTFFPKKWFHDNYLISNTSCRGGSRTAATSKMERFVIIVNGWKPFTIITKRSILEVAEVLGPLWVGCQTICFLLGNTSHLFVKLQIKILMPWLEYQYK